MIGSLNGKIKTKFENKLIIEVNGVGYLVEVADMSRIEAESKESHLYIYTYVREDQLDLYGFKTMEERQLFKILLSVSRIGPKAAINILSHLSYDRFINAILTENIAVLKEVKGIGPKTAQRLVLELKNKVDELAKNISIDENETNQDDEELYDAILSLGYSRKEIDKAKNDIDFAQDENLENKIKKVLSALGKESL